MRSAINLAILIALLGCERPKALPVVVAGGPHQSSHLPFDWSIYEDPSRPEFWADGADGVLPRPFLHLAAYPSPENAARLASWQRRQWEVIGAIIQALGGASELKMLDHAVGGDFLAEVSKLEIDAPAQKRQSTKIAWAEVAVVYIYRSSCQFCRKQQSLINSLKTLGVQLTALQLEAEKEKPLVEDSQDYARGEWSEYFPLDSSQTTPTFYLAKKGAPPLKHVGALTLPLLAEILSI